MIFPSTSRVHYETIVNPVWPMADIAVACIEPLPKDAFANCAVPDATWTAQPHENEGQFRRRIEADVAAAQALLPAHRRSGCMITIYEKSGFWRRNVIGRTELASADSKASDGQKPATAKKAAA